jgi:lipooligosaccharide transport system permease protein
LPRGLREVAYATPLWHGVDLIRKLSLGTATLGLSVLHVAYLAVWFVAGVILARRAYAGRLVT